MAAVFVDLKYLCILSCELVCRAPFSLHRFSRSVSLLEIARERASAGHRDFCHAKIAWKKKEFPTFYHCFKCSFSLFTICMSAQWKQ